MLARGMILVVGLASLSAMASMENAESQYSAFKQYQCFDNQGKQTARFYFDAESMVAYVPSTGTWNSSRKLSCSSSAGTGDLRCYTYSSPLGYGFTLAPSGEYQSYSQMCGFAGCKTTYSEKSFCYETATEMTIQ